MDTGKAAVIVVDIQKDFGTKGGTFDRAGLDISMIQRAVAPARKFWPRPDAQASRSFISRWAFIAIFRTLALQTLPIGFGTCGWEWGSCSCP